MAETVGSSAASRSRLPTYSLPILSSVEKSPVESVPSIRMTLTLECPFPAIKYTATKIPITMNRPAMMINSHFRPARGAGAGEIVAG